MSITRDFRHVGFEMELTAPICFSTVGLKLNTRIDKYWHMGMNMFLEMWRKVRINIWRGEEERLKNEHSGREGFYLRF